MISNLIRAIVIEIFFSTGELLSTSSSAVYFFEPFFYHVRNNISLSSLPDELIAGVLRQLLTCQLQRSPVMREARFRRFIWKSDGSDARLTPSTRLMERRCGASFSRVVKVVRPSLTSVLTLLHDPQLGPHVRVVHLVRDPRGVVNSQLNNSDIWPAVRRRPTAICGRLTRDLAVAGTLSDPRYTRVHYEDLALYPRETAVRLFRAIGLPPPPSLQTFLARHWNQSQPVPVDRLPLPRRDMSPRQLSRWRNYIRMKRGRKAAQAYFSTTRGSSFDPFHWRRDLRPELRRRIESDCADVLDFLRTDPSAKHVRDLRQSL